MEKDSVHIVVQTNEVGKVMSLTVFDNADSAFAYQQKLVKGRTAASQSDWPVPGIYVRSVNSDSRSV